MTIKNKNFLSFGQFVEVRAIFVKITILAETNITFSSEIFRSYFWVILEILGLFLLKPTGPPNQCEQIGRFLKILGKKLSYKSSPNIIFMFWLLSIKYRFISELVLATF